jgi:hypothetical protein
MPRLSALPLLAALGLGCILLTGCAGYHLGNTAEPRFSHLFIAPVKSDTLIPQAAAVVTTQLREAFLKDGRTALVNSEAEADAVLTVRLRRYARDITVTRSDDTGLARRFDVTLEARATLTDRRSGQALFTDRTLQAKRGVFTDGSQLQSEYQALPQLAEDLAHAAVSLALDTW